jgi:hypothetical protein
MPGPHADYACLSPKCRQPDGAAVYDLPVGSTRCPVCGSKRLQRLFNAVNVGRGMAAHVDSLVEPEVQQQRELFEAAQAAPQTTDLAVAERARLLQEQGSRPTGQTIQSGGVRYGVPAIAGMIPPQEKLAARATNLTMFDAIGRRGPMPATRLIVR